MVAMQKFWSDTQKKEICGIRDKNSGITFTISESSINCEQDSVVKIFSKI